MRIKPLLIFVAILLVVAGIAYLKLPPGDLPKPVRPESEQVACSESFQYEGSTPKNFHEAPSLADRVAKGELPTVDHRLPQEPLVITPVEKIGKYGGTWRRAFTGPSDCQSIERILHDHVIYYDLDGATLVPHIAKSWEAEQGGRVFTFQLRKGMKWSDGHPFTAADFLFAYEDILLNDELKPVKPEWLRAGDEVGKATKLDDYTVRYTFSKPNHVFPERFASILAGGQSIRVGRMKAPYAPAHYLKQFHPKYTDKKVLKQKVEEAGLSNWGQLFQQRAALVLNPELPAIGPWKTVQPITAQHFILERNPYYWVVDPEGNQLPYIDRIVMHLATNMEVLNLRAIAGEIDMQHRHIHLAKVPVLKANGARGKYRVLFWPSLGGTEAGVFFNQTFDADKEVAHWLRDKEFRVALSLAIDREAINELVFLGTGTPRAFICAPNTQYYPGPEYENKYAQLDRSQAGAILDRIGLDKKDDAGFRLRSDGKGRLRIKLAVVSAAFVDFTGIAELLAEQWAKVGLKIEVSVEERSLFFTRCFGNEQQLCLWDTAGAENPWTSPRFVIPVGRDSNFAPLAGTWYQTDGRSGVEPTGDIKRLIELYDQGKLVPQDQRIPLGQEIWRIHAENLYIIGTVGLSPAANGVVVVKNNFRNVPKVAPNSSSLQNPGVARPEQFFFDD